MSLLTLCSKYEVLFRTSIAAWNHGRQKLAETRIEEKRSAELTEPSHEVMRKWAVEAFNRTGLTRRALAKAIAKRTGRPMQASALTNITSGRRRILADEAVVVENLSGMRIPFF